MVNLSREEKCASTALKEVVSRIVHSANKGNTIVIRNDNQYKDKMKEILRERPYKSIRNLTQKIVTVLNKANKLAD